MLTYLMLMRSIIVDHIFKHAYRPTQLLDHVEQVQINLASLHPIMATALSAVHAGMHFA